MTRSRPGTDALTDAAAGIERAHRLWRQALPTLVDDAVGGPSALPGWTRGHVLAHVAGLGAAVVRQAEAAVAGEVVEFYVGGRPARDRAIEEGAAHPAAAHIARVEATLDAVEHALAGLTGAVLTRATGYRDRPAADLLHLWWRESLVHVTDVAVGIGHLTAWDAPFRRHLVTYLAPRVPAGVLLTIEPWDVDEQHVAGAGEEVVVQGMAADVVAWLAGREPGGTVVAERAGASAPLPDLGPWP